MFIYIGTYPDEASARADYDVVKDLHLAGAVGTYDAAVVTKDDKGKVHVNKDETATRHGAWGGAAVGGVLAVLFPPSILVGAGVGAAIGGVSGHVWKGMSRADVKELGDLIDDGEAALVIVGESTIEQYHRQGRPEGREAPGQAARRQHQGPGQGHPERHRRGRQLTIAADQPNEGTGDGPDRHRAARSRRVDVRPDGSGHHQRWWTPDPGRSHALRRCTSPIGLSGSSDT